MQNVPIFLEEFDEREFLFGIQGVVSHAVLRPKLDAHRMYAQDQVVIHTVRM
jgi:hypothetical protein